MSNVEYEIFIQEYIFNLKGKAYCLQFKYNGIISDTIFNTNKLTNFELVKQLKIAYTDNISLMMNLLQHDYEEYLTLHNNYDDIYNFCYDQHIKYLEQYSQYLTEQDLMKIKNYYNNMENIGILILTNEIEVNECDVNECDVNECDVNECDVNECDVNECDVNECDVNECDVNECDVNECDVNDYNVNECDVNKCDVNECVVNEYVLNQCMVNECDVNECVVNEYVLNQCMVNECVVNEFVINESVVNECVVNECVVSKCEISDCELSNRKVGKYEVSECSVSECSVSKCKVSKDAHILGDKQTDLKKYQRTKYILKINKLISEYKEFNYNTYNSKVKKYYSFIINKDNKFPRYHINGLIYILLNSFTHRHDINYLIIKMS